MYLILYSKPGCHLCEGLQEKLAQVQQISIDLEVRDITTNPQWFNAYQYEIPVLFWVPSGGAVSSPMPLPRISPRATVQQVEQWLQKVASDC